MQPEAETRIGVLSRICDAVLIAMSVLVVPALAASLARIETIGWQPLMALHGFMTLGIWTVMLLRRRLPYGVRSWFVVGVLIAIGLLGIGTFGLIGSAGIFIPFAAVLASILLGHRAGGFVLVVTILAAGVIATPLVLGQWLPDFDLVAYATSPSAWVAEGFAWLMLGGICVVALGILNSYFVETVTTTKRQAEALELSQREYRDIFENLVDTVYRADLDGKILTISPSIMDMLGFEPEEVIGKKLSDFYVTPSNRDELVADLQVTDGDVRNFEAQMYHRNGQPQWISTNVRYWKDIDGSVLGVEGVARNISSHKAGEEALQRSQKMEALRNLTGGVAHDFNNLLGVIIGHAELLAEDSATSTPVDENVVEILQAAEQAAVLTRRLLTFARPEMLAAEPVTLNEVIHGLEGTMRRALGERVTLRLDLGTQDAETLVDLPELRTALLNLAINSREAMLNGGELSIETTNTTIDTVAAGSLKGLEPGDYLRVVVRDNGAGMTDETARNAIEPFFTTKPLSAGKGLGLTMIDSFMTQSHGHVSIASKWGEGTSVTLLLPRSNGVTQAPEATEPEPTGVAARILVVEDDPALRALSLAVLRRQGYKVAEAANGPEALDLLRHDTGFDLLFTDVVLPGEINGFEISREASRIRGDIKILLTSGYASKVPTEEDPVAKLPIIYKPYHRAQLLTTIEEVLAGSGSMETSSALVPRSAMP